MTAEKAMEEARAVLAAHVPKSWREGILSGQNNDWGHIRPSEAIAAMLTYRDQVRREVEAEVERECQSVWRCAIGDATASLDVLKDQWIKSRRKHEREAGAKLDQVLNLVWAARDPASGSYSQAAANGKVLVERVRGALAGTPGDAE